MSGQIKGNKASGQWQLLRNTPTRDHTVKEMQPLFAILEKIRRRNCNIYTEKYSAVLVCAPNSTSKREETEKREGGRSESQRKPGNHQRSFVQLSTQLNSNASNANTEYRNSWSTSHEKNHTRTQRLLDSDERRHQ